MQPHAVKLEFLSEDDGWTGSCPQLQIAVRGNNFEESKKKMEEALQAKIESVLQTRSGNVAA